MTLGELNSYSSRFAERLFRAHPDWRPLARVDPDGGPPPGSFVVEVASPVPGRSLTLRTYADQVTVDFGPHGWHEHFGVWTARGESAIFDAALAFLEDLVAERVVVATRFLFARPAWSRTYRLERAPRRPLVGRVEIYSWRGTHDATLQRG